MRAIREGFTLIEIMVVVLILGLLVSMGTWGVLKSMNSSNVKEAEIELEMLGVAVRQLAWDTGKWPNGADLGSAGSTEIWDLSGGSGLVTTNDNTYENWKGPYYEGALTDPWGKPYFFDPDYRIDGANRIVVGSFGPNRVGPNQYDHDDVKVTLDD